MKYLIALSLLMTTPIFAQAFDDLTEGKIQAAEADWLKGLENGVAQREQKALTLIGAVAELSNERFSIGNDIRREEADYAHTGFVARFQGIREDREALAKKQLSPDYKDLKNYTVRLDKLITDIEAFLK
jgi:hypothetical protein